MIVQAQVEPRVLPRSRLVAQLHPASLNHFHLSLALESATKRRGLLLNHQLSLWRLNDQLYPTRDHGHGHVPVLWYRLVSRGEASCDIINIDRVDSENIVSISV